MHLLANSLPSSFHPTKPISTSLNHKNDLKTQTQRNGFLEISQQITGLAIFCKCLPVLYNVFGSNRGEHVEACEQLKILENELAIKGKKFFGGDSINLVDIAAAFVGYWLGLIEEATDIKFVIRDKFPKIVEWADEFINCQVVKEILPPSEVVLAFYRKRFGNM